MDIRTKVTDYQMTDAVQRYLDDKVAVIEKHIGERARQARLEIEIGKSGGHSKHGENWFAELQVRIPGGNYARVVCEAETVQAAIDEAKDEMLRKLRTSKIEHTSFLRKSGAALKRMLRME